PTSQPPPTTTAATPPTDCSYSGSQHENASALVDEPVDLVEVLQQFVADPPDFPRHPQNSVRVIEIKRQFVRVYHGSEPSDLI
ncbi:hypothetical protein ACIBI9_59945, partial [Nonomuraea sp. NPDC050451]|uniref:hypothetical protein n=1 Tax=Nonomuraea sp. NPDC050451 TaxID=3364364 RepID=UPI0037BAB988